MFLSLGSNQGDRSTNLHDACMKIRKQVGKIVRSSSIYSTAAWGVTDQPDFLNQVIEVETNLTPGALLEKTHSIEKSLGRIRTGKWGARIIDIDILLYREVELKTAHLVIPHPELPNRKFVLIPFAEIAADHVHPTAHKKISELLDTCTDQLAVTKFIED
ncbi:2-amino-4-hydroxy-6-hydroxymethyldihydropteridine diphosphokinase [Pseudochryseolinea flava]|uniref:2-amino-4-hydroxy-6-hydroxymethyldihydropteridine pyrophosphokinase n=1 Tax=Pseudochryseolinea flava TaxID=2059302 RepID=A0A364Y538_9BACT|nr:2-amino-4-hydroxy-6-hydroxymethyldihydropteridine diphosphokinase [Pseudochryseolinea flava]